MNDQFNELLQQQHELIQHEADKLTLTTSRLEKEINQVAAARDFARAAELQKALEQLLQEQLAPPISGGGRGTQHRQALHPPHLCPPGLDSAHTLALCEWLYKYFQVCCR